jgi:hypothetical protein
MPNTYVDYTAPQANYSFNFPYLDVAHVKVFVDNVEKTQGTHYNVVTSPTRVVFTTGNTPANGATIRIRRVTFKDSALVDFANGSTILESDLDTAVRQTLYINQETTELNDTALQIGAGTANFYAQGKKITDVANPTNANDAANKTYVDTADALKVAKAGDTMTGNLAMSGNRVTGLADPASSQDAATRNFVNTQVSNAVKFSSTTAPDVSSFTGDGVQTVFTLGSETVNSIIVDSAYLVTLNGVTQKPTTDYVISASSGNVIITFLTAPANNVSIVVFSIGFKIPIGAAQLDAGSIDSTKLATDSVTTAKIQDLAVTAGKLATSLDFTGKTVTNINKTAVGLGDVPNTDATNASNISSGILASARLSDSGVTAGTVDPRNISSFAVDAKGRITSVANFTSGRTPLSVATLNANWGRQTAPINQYATYNLWQQIGGGASTVWTINLNYGSGLAANGTYTAPVAGVYEARIQGLLLGAGGGYCQIALGQSSASLPFYTYQNFLGYGMYHLVGLFDIAAGTTISPFMFITANSWFTHSGYTTLTVRKVA